MDPRAAFHIGESIVYPLHGMGRIDEVCLQMIEDQPQCCYRLVLLGCLLTGVLAWTAPGADATTQLTTTAECNIVMNFRNTDIRQVITLMSELTGKIFLVAPRVRGTVTLVAPTPLCVDDAYQVFLSALTLQGLTVVSQGAIHKILPARKAKTKAVPVVVK